MGTRTSKNSNEASVRKGRRLAVHRWQDFRRAALEGPGAALPVYPKGDD